MNTEQTTTAQNQLEESIEFSLKEIHRLKRIINSRYGNAPNYLEALNYCAHVIRKRGLTFPAESIVRDYEEYRAVNEILRLTQEDIDSGEVTKVALERVPVGLMDGSLNLSNVLDK